MSVTPTTLQSNSADDIGQNEPVQFQKCVRTILLNHSGTPQDGESIGRAWFMPTVGTNGTKIFGSADDNGDVAQGNHGIYNARVNKVELLEYSSTFPMNLKLDASGFPKNASDMHGNRAFLHCLPGRHSGPEVLFEADHSSGEAAQWQKKFPEYTSENLTSHGLMEVRAAPIIFVDKSHPVCALLRSNKEYLGQDLNEQQLVQGKWHTIARPIFEHAVGVLRKTVLSQVHHVTLANCAFHLEPVGKSSWGDVKPEFDKAMSHAIASDHVDSRALLAKATEEAQARPYGFSARLRFTYEYPMNT